MVTRTAGEIIHGAQVKAGVFNIDFLDYLTVTNELNNAYREAYAEIANSDSDFFIKSAVFYEGTFPLPKDLFKIKTVAFLCHDGSWKTIDKQPPKQYVYGQYYIEDNIFHYNGDANLPILIRYVPIPNTITCPRESEEIEIDVNTVTEFGKMTEKGFYYKTEEGYFYYSFESLQTEEITEEEYKEKPSTYLRHDIVIDYENQTVTATDKFGEEEDWTEIFTIPDNPFINIVFDSPYAMVTYEDGNIRIFNQFTSANWNIKASTGHETLGKIHGLKTNDKTLFGCLYEDEDGYLYRASFVPDTVMSYPSNALFNYLEVILARLFLSMNGMENGYIQKELFEQVRWQFRKELQQNSAAVSRPANYLRRRLNGF